MRYTKILTPDSSKPKTLYLTTMGIAIVAVTTHLYDGKKSVPLDIEIYQPASSLAEGKEDKEFKKKPEIAIDLIDRSLTRGYRCGRNNPA